MICQCTASVTEGGLVLSQQTGAIGCAQRIRCQSVLFVVAELPNERVQQ